MKNLLSVLLLMAVVALLFSLPATMRLDSVAIGEPHSDVWNSLWLMWVVPTALLDGQLQLSHLSLLIDPAGINLWPHLGNFLLPLLMAPVTLLKGPVLSANLALILVLFLNCLLSFLFLRRLTGDDLASLPPAMAVGASTYVLAEAAYGNVELAGIFVLPLAAITVIRLGEKPTPLATLWLFLSLTLAALWNVYYGLAAFVFSVLAVAGVSVKSRSWRPAVVGGSAILAATGTLLSLFVVLLRGGSPVSPAGPAVSADSSLDLLELVHFSRPYPDTVPYFLLALALLALFVSRQETVFWWIAAFVLFLFALGPTIHILGEDTRIPGPYRLLQWLPGLERARWPYRFAPMAMLALAAAAAFALHFLMEKAGAKSKNMAAGFKSAGVLLALAASFFHVPHPVVSIQVPEAYQALDRAGAGAILELPAADNFYANSIYLFYQTRHGRPVLVAQPLPDLPPGYPPAALRAAPGLAPLAGFPPDPFALGQVDAEKLKADLQSLGVRFIAWHPRDLPDPYPVLVSSWCDAAFGAPLSRSENVVLYRVY